MQEEEEEEEKVIHKHSSSWAIRWENMFLSKLDRLWELNINLLLLLRLYNAGVAS